MIRKTYQWNNEDLGLLRANYLTKSISELEELIGRNAGGIKSKLRRELIDNPSTYDRERIELLVGQCIGRRKLRFGDWNEEEMNTLQRYHKTKSLSELEDLTGRTAAGIVGKLLKLRDEEPGMWDAHRITRFNTEVQNVYRERREKSDVKDKKEYLSFIEREKYWNEFDVLALKHVYLTRNLRDIMKVFRLKDIDPLEKLKELYTQDKSSWDFDRIKSLEEQKEKIYPLRTYSWGGETDLFKQEIGYLNEVYEGIRTSTINRLTRKAQKRGL